MNIEIVKRSDQATGFVALPKRWIVERTFAWLGRCRRLAKDWECLNHKALAFLRLASIRLMLRKLCNPADVLGQTLRAISGRTSDSIDNLRREAASCQACPLWIGASQTVFGEGPANAEIMFVGEHPEMRKIATDARSSGRPDACWTKRWRTRVWTAHAFM